MFVEWTCSAMIHVFMSRVVVFSAVTSEWVWLVWNSADGKFNRGSVPGRHLLCGLFYMKVVTAPSLNDDSEIKLAVTLD